MSRKITVLTAGIPASHVRNLLAQEPGFENLEITAIGGDNISADYDRISEKKRPAHARITDPNALGVAGQLLQIRNSSVEAALIIIQNNMGAGVDRARSVPPAHRHKILVVSTSGLSTQEETTYREHGVTHFGETFETEQLLAEIRSIVEAPQDVPQTD